MVSFWGQVLITAILTLQITPITSQNLTSIGSDIDSTIAHLGEDFDAFENDVKDDVESAVRNGGGVLANLTMGVQTTPPISTRLVTSGIESNVVIGLYCEECGFPQPQAFDFASHNFSGWDSSWLGFALESFDAMIEVDVELNADPDGSLTLELWNITVAQDDIVVEVAFQLYLVAKASASMSFSAGLNLSLTEPAGIMMPALDPLVQLNESRRIGFSPENFNLTPIFNASMPQLDFTVQLSLRTVFSVTVENINIGALYLDLPAFNLTVDTLTNALSNCQAAPSGTSSDDVYAELIHVNGALVAELSYELLGGENSGILDTWKIHNATDDCYAFFPGLGSIGAVPASPQSPLLTAAAVTTCTTGDSTGTTGTTAVAVALKSLSSGAKAGAVIGTLAGVTIIAVIAWYGGRVSLQRSLKRSETRTGTASVWKVPRPRSGKFFSRGGHPGMTEFSPVNPRTPAWQTTPYEIVKTQARHQGWQMAKKEPAVTVDEVVTPATTYISIGDDYGMPTTGIKEADASGYNSRGQHISLRSSEGVGAGPAEGIESFRNESRPVVKRKEVRGKPDYRQFVPRESQLGQGSGSKIPFLQS